MMSHQRMKRSEALTRVVNSSLSQAREKVTASRQESEERNITYLVSRG